jgi:predicted phage tail protein
LSSIKGQFGGGGGGGGVPIAPELIEEDDTLASRTTARVLLLVGEGEIQGTTQGDLLKDIYLDETPIQREDGLVLFPGANAQLLPGTPTQNPADGFNFTETEVPVGVEAIANIPIVRQFSNPSATQVSVRVVVPELWSIFEVSEGGVTNRVVGGTTVEFTITITLQGGSSQSFPLSITGKATSAYERNYLIDLPGAGPWLIEFERTTPDSEDENELRNKTIFQSFTIRTGNPFRSPYSALLAIRVRADQFQAVPAISARLRGLRVRVPNNYNPTDRTYSGFWNGQFAPAAWTSNPAWIYYDLLTNERYGVGRFLDSDQIDVYSLYAIAQYCDELVPDGTGGLEPRFTCNCYIQNRDDAYSVLNGLASIFRGVLYWSEGMIVASQDRPGEPVRLYTEANVVQTVDDQGNITRPPFSYSGTARRARHTVAIVSYADPKDLYKNKVEYVEDREGILRYGYREIEITAFGCASRGQAQRAGRWTLITERLETETVNFRVATEGLLVRPGEIIKVADPLKGGQRFGGRIVSATSSTVTLDQEVNANGGILSVLNTDGQQVEAPCSGVGATIAASFGFIPQAESVWILSVGNVQPRLYRVIGVTEQEDGAYEITGVLHAPEKYAAVDNNTIIPNQSYSGLAITPQNVSQNSIQITVQ